MRMLPSVVLVGAVVFGTCASAQDAPVVVTKPTYTAEAMRARVGSETSGLRVSCRLANGTEHAVTTEVALGGRRFRCVTVLDESLIPAGAAWTPVGE